MDKMSDYTKCENYPGCTFVECECYQTWLFKQCMDGIPARKIDDSREVLRFDIIDNNLIPVYKSNSDGNPKI